MVADEGLARRFQRAKEEEAYWERHYPDFLAKYPDQWVAVHDGKLIARTEHLSELVQELERQGFDPRETWFTFLNATRRAISL
jgi:hypothetical protein